MTDKECKAVFNSVFDQYSKEMWIHEGDPGRGNGACAYIIRREIILPEGTFESPEEWDILVLLHEVGHIKTNTPKMKTYEKEYRAVQWSATEARKLGLHIRGEWRKAYQEYIWKKRQMCINRKGKNVASKESLVIQW